MGELSPHGNTAPLNFSHELNNVVRRDHTALNKLITSRLPLCLPPHTDNALLYLQGLQAFGSIYEVFEKQFSQELQRHAPPHRILCALGLLDVPGLHRTKRLRRDIDEVQIRFLERDLVLDDSIRRQAMDLLQDTLDRFVERPHLVLAHAWAMYLALFNGGRWICKQLRAAGDDFWMGPPPLSFWEFEGDQDGYDVHARFKKNFELAIQQLTDEERREVVDEARTVFALCSRLVGMLDETSAAKPPKKIGPTAEKVIGFKARTWSMFGYLWLLCLLVIVWSFLLQTNTTWKGLSMPGFAAKIFSVR